MKRIITLCILFTGIGAIFEGCLTIKEPVKVSEKAPAENPHG